MKIFLSFAALLCATLCFAQTKVSDKQARESDSWLAFTASISAPVGDYADDSKSSSNAGWAEAGLFYKLDLGIKCYRNIGIMASPFLGYNGVNESNVDDLIIASGYTYKTVEIQKWKYYGILVGPYFRIPDERSPFYIKAQAGYIHATSPDLYVNVGVPGSFVSIHQEAKDAGAVVFAVGMGVNLRMNDMVALNLGLDYVTAKPKFENVEAVITDGSKYVSTQGTFKQSMTILLPTVGLAWKL